MICPYRKVIKIYENQIPKVTREEFAECYKNECLYFNSVRKIFRAGLEPIEVHDICLKAEKDTE